MGRSSITKIALLVGQNAARASSNLSVLILLKLSSAFDTINHQILLSTLAELGIADSALTWFTSYLTNRTFQVTWNGSLSKPCFLETGVTQGPVLGLLLFSLYTRSLGSAITSHGFSYHCYPEDTQFSSVFSPILLQQLSWNVQCLADISAWTAAYHFRLNISKTELLFNPEKDCPHMDLSVTVEDVTVCLKLHQCVNSYSKPALWIQKGCDSTRHDIEICVFCERVSPSVYLTKRVPADCL